MRRYLFLAMVLLASTVTLAQTWPITYNNVANPDLLRRLLQSRFDEVDDDIDEIKEVGTGKIFYVDSAVGSDTYDGTTPAWAKATLDAAIGACTADRGDIIYVMQTSDETKSVTGALWTADVDGITIKGLGNGWNRPTFLLSHTGAKIDVTGDGIRIENIIIDATGVDSVNTPVNLSGVGSGFVNCYFHLADGTGQADLGLTVGVADADADDGYVVNCTFMSPNAGAASAITFAKDMKNFTIANSYIYGDFSTAGIEIPAGGNAQVGFLVYNTTVISKNADEPALEANGTGNTGAIVSCFFASDAEATILDAGGLSVSDDTKLVIIGNGEGAALPANMTLVDLIGDYTGPDNGAAADDNIKAHLDLIKTAVDATATDTAAMDTHAEMKVLVDPNGVLYDAPRIISDTTSAMTAGNGYTAAGDPVIFTVTGSILARAFAIVDTAVTSTSTDTVELGVAGDTACLLVQDQVDGVAFQQNDCWTLDQAADTPSAEMDTNWVVIPNGLDIQLFINDHDLTAGVVTFYLQWIPLSTNAAVVGAAP